LQSCNAARLRTQLARKRAINTFQINSSMEALGLGLREQWFFFVIMQ
jgi:hypothetical protein